MRYVLAVLLAAVCFGTTGTAQALGPDAGPLSVGAARLVIGGSALAVIAGVQVLVARRRRRGRASGPASVASTDGSGAAPSVASMDPTRTTRTTGTTGTTGITRTQFRSARGVSDAPSGEAARDTPARLNSLRRKRMPVWSLVALGAGGVVAYQPAFFAGTDANGVAIGTVVALGSAPVLTGALDWATRRRHPGGRWLVATAIATVGVAVLAFSSDGAHAAADPAGLAASLAAGLSYAVYTLAAKALIDRGWAPTSSMAALFGAAAAVALPLLLVTDASWLATPAGLAMALWLGLVTTTLAYVLFGAGLAGLAPATVSTLTLAEPLTAGVLGVALLGEVLTAGAVVGLLVLAAGLVVLAVPGRRRPPARPPAPVSEGPDTVTPWTSSSSPASGSTATPGAR